MSPRLVCGARGTYTYTYTYTHTGTYTYRCTYTYTYIYTYTYTHLKAENEVVTRGEEESVNKRGVRD